MERNKSLTIGLLVLNHTGDVFIDWHCTCIVKFINCRYLLTNAEIIIIIVVCPMQNSASRSVSTVGVKILKEDVLNCFSGCPEVILVLEIRKQRRMSVDYMANAHKARFA